MSRRKARELAFKVLFQVDQVNAEPFQAIEYLLQDSDSTLPEKDREFARELIEACLKRLPEIDSSIARYSNDWSVDRMSSVDRNLMRIAVCEMMYIDGSQPVVAIDEAIEISKRYGETNSAGFINAILDKIRSDKK